MIGNVLPCGRFIMEPIKRPATAEFDLGKAEGIASQFVIPSKKPRVAVEDKKKIRVLVLFSGTKSVSRALNKYFPNEYEIVTVDLDPKHKPTHNVNVLTWDFRKVYKEGDFDYMWCR